ALETYQSILESPNARQALDTIALQTGELYRSTELTTDGSDPVFAPDGRRFAFTTNIAIASDRTVHVRAIDKPGVDLTTIKGADASFCPDGRQLAFVRTQATPEITQAQNAFANAAPGAERASRLQELNRATARASKIFVRDLESGRDDASGGSDSYR